MEGVAHGRRDGPGTGRLPQVDTDRQTLQEAGSAVCALRGPCQGRLRAPGWPTCQPRKVVGSCCARLRLTPLPAASRAQCAHSGDAADGSAAGGAGRSSSGNGAGVWTAEERGGGAGGGAQQALVLSALPHQEVGGPDPRPARLGTCGSQPVTPIMRMLPSARSWRRSGCIAGHWAGYRVGCRV